MRLPLAATLMYNIEAARGADKPEQKPPLKTKNKKIFAAALNKELGFL
jgi:hypothetical protein